MKTNQMLSNKQVDLSFTTSKQCLPEQLKLKTVMAVVLALGSNYQAEHYLSRVHKALATLGKTQFSTALQNPDFTATLHQPKPNYINQCVYLLLTLPLTFQQLQQTFKKFERECDRCRQDERTAIKRVTMDIDILLVKLNDANEWIIMADRYPFKAHERVGVAELAVDSL